MTHAAWLASITATVVGLWHSARSVVLSRRRRREQAAEQARMVAAIMGELHPNGGGSLRDAVDRLERIVGELTEDHARLHARIDKVYEVVASPRRGR